MSEPQAVLVRCDGAPIPTVGGPWDREVLLTTRGAKPSVNLKIEGLQRKVIGKIDARVDDLIRIAAFVYAADLEVSRGGLADAHLVRWKRDITLCIPVRDATFWSQVEVRTALVDALGFATEDWWSFVFTLDGLHQLNLEMDPSLADATPDSVVLFSGGTDSMCATLQAVLEQGHKPILVSHRSAGHHARRHSRLIEELDQRIESWGFPHISFWVQSQTGRDGHETQRSRAFLYAALGAAVAAQARVKNVQLADNGYVSINPPINGQIVGAIASRGTHPTFLRLVNTLFRLVFSGAVTVRNPLDDQTRAEALGVLVRHKLGSLLRLTRSCGKSLRVKGHPHCGICSQCVDRRFAALHAGLGAFDPVDGYEVDCFLAPLKAGRERTLIRSYGEFALTSDRLGPEDLFLEVAELSGAIDPKHPTAAAEAERMARLLVRHGEEVLTVMADQVAEHRQALVRGQVNQESLLGSWPGFAGPRAERENDVENRGAILPTPLIRPRIVAAVERTMEGSALREPTPIRAGTSDPETVDRIHVLRRIGKTWIIAFGDEKGDFPDSAGWRRLLRLLQYPGQNVKAIDLAAGSNPTRKKATPQRSDDGADDDVVEVFETASKQVPSKTGPSSNVDEILDPLAIDQLDDRIKQLPFELDAARRAGDQATWLVLNHEYEECKAERRRLINIRRQSRRFNVDDERARTTVSKTVNAVIASFALTMPSLHQHLDEFVHLGFDCVYDPRPPEHWMIAS